MAETEGKIQRDIITALEGELLGCVVTHVANEIQMNGPKAALAVKKLRQNGVLKGFPDLIVQWRGVVAYIEVKTPTGKTSPEQDEVLKRLADNGAITAVMDTKGAVPALAQVMRGVRPMGQVS